MMICGVPSEDSAPRATDCTTPLVESPFESVDTVTVLPIRLLAWSAESEEDIAVDCVKDVNCAICAAMSVSDCGSIGSWFSIWATRSWRKSFCVRVCCDPPETVSGEVPLEAALAAAAIEEADDIFLLVFDHAQVSQPADAFTRAAGCVNVPVAEPANVISVDASRG
jgi:hypothetical protein